MYSYIFILKAMSFEECSICCSNFNKSWRKPVECNNCHFRACVTCNKQFIVGTNSEVKCMKCNVAWSMNFLYSNFPVKFIKEYRCHRRTILWNKELYHAPQIAAYIGHKSCYEKNMIAERQLKISIAEKKLEYKALKGKRGKMFTEERKKIQMQKKDLEVRYCNLNRETNFFYSNYHRIFYNFTENKKDSSKSSYNRPCIQENCRGFLDTKGNCPICHSVVCLECNILQKTKEHECKEDDVNTWNELKKNTRPCPKCNVRIHKISGCDQMWCVHCNTPFSWTRGTIEHGNIHNPHYFDWLFQGGTAVNPVAQPVAGECNENVLPHVIRIQNYLSNNATYSREIYKMYQLFTHFCSVEIPKFESNQESHRLSKFKYLVRHVRGEKDIDKRFEIFIQREHLRNEFATLLQNYKQQQIHLLNAMLHDTISDKEFMKQSEDLKQLYRNAFHEFNKFYKKKYTVPL